MRLILDRFEGEFAVLTDENLHVYDIERCRLPTDSREDDIFEAEIRDGAVESIKRVASYEGKGKNSERLRSLFDKKSD